MKGLLFLGLVGAAIYALLIYTHNALPDGNAASTFAGQTQPDVPIAQHLSSWGTHLPSRSSSQNPQGQLATSQQSASSTFDAAGGPRSYDPNSERRPDAEYQPAASEAKTPDSRSGGGAPADEWAKVMLAAKMHDQASVSSPTVRFYSPGTDLQVVRREGSWLKVSDPATQEHGWILEKYLSSIDGPKSTQTALESTTDAAPAKATSRKSKKSSQSSKRSKHVVAKSDPWKGRWARRGDRQRGFALFMLGPAR